MSANSWSNPRMEATAVNVDWRADGVISDGEYQKHELLGGSFELFWRSDGNLTYVGMRAKTKGWLAMGILPGPQAKQNVDMIQGYVRNGTTTVRDLFSANHRGGAQPHQVDTDLGSSNDIVEFGAKEQGGYTTIEFKRKHVTADAYDQPLHKGLNYIAWAYGETEDPESMHAKAGYGQIEL